MKTARKFLIAALAIFIAGYAFVYPHAVANFSSLKWLFDGLLIVLGFGIFLLPVAGVVIVLVTLNRRTTKLTLWAIPQAAISIGILHFFLLMIFDDVFAFGLSDDDYSWTLVILDAAMKGAFVDFMESFEIDIYTFHPQKNLLVYQMIVFAIRSIWSAWVALTLLLIFRELKRLGFLERFGIRQKSEA